MKPTYIWKIEGVDNKDKEYFQKEIELLVVSKIQIPEEYKNQSLKITIYKDRSLPRKHYHIAGQILSATDDFIAEYQLNSNPSISSELGTAHFSYRKTLQF